MKKLILSAIISFVTLCSFGQVTLEKTYQPDRYSYEFSFVKFFNEELMYLYRSHDTKVFTLYNDDHSLYKNFDFSNIIPDTLDIYKLQTHKINSTIVFLIEGYYEDDNFSVKNGYHYLFDENMTQLFNFDTLSPAPKYSISTPQIITPQNKLLVRYSKDNPNAQYNSSEVNKIYSLASSPNGTSTTQEKPSINLKAYPNPSTASETTISYELPPSSTFGEMKIYNSKGIEVDAFKIGKHFNSIKVNTSAYTNGTYICKVYANGTLTSAEKLVILK